MPTSRTSRWLVPGVCALAACLYLGIFLARGEPAIALAAGGAMLGYGVVLLLLRAHGDAAAVLSEYQPDERRQQIGLRAARFSVNVAALAAVTGAVTELVAGRDPGAWGVMCLVVGASYLAGVIFYSRRI